LPQLLYSVPALLLEVAEKSFAPRVYKYRDIRKWLRLRTVCKKDTGVLWMIEIAEK